jgi:N-acetylneuraminic acid mutarotase
MGGAGGFVSAAGVAETTASVLAFDSRRAAWTAVAPMPTAREKLRLVAAGRHLYAIGGLSPAGQTLSTVERYDPRSNTWTAVASMNQDRGVPGAVVVNRGHERLIVVVGGAQAVDFQSGPFLRSTEVYSLDTGRWRVLKAQLPRGRASLVCAAESDGTVLAIGGAVDLGVPTAEVHALELGDHDRSRR